MSVRTCVRGRRVRAPDEERAFFAAEIDRVAPQLIDLASLSEAAFQQRARRHADFAIEAARFAAECGGGFGQLGLG
ncbi:MAG: hypothetical protein U0559_09390 [Anaerolineae bacterium]